MGGLLNRRVRTRSVVLALSSCFLIGLMLQVLVVPALIILWIEYLEYIHWLMIAL